MGSGLLLNSMLEVENEFSTFCTTTAFNVFASIIARAETRAANAYQDFSLD